MVRNLFRRSRICYDSDMLLKRRVFDLTNTILNYMFLVQVLLFILYCISFWIKLRQDYIAVLVTCINVAAWTVTVLSLVIVILGFFIYFRDKAISVRTMVWSLFRMLLSVAMTILVDVFSVVVAGEISVAL